MGQSTEQQLTMGNRDVLNKANISPQLQDLKEEDESFDLRYGDTSPHKSSRRPLSDLSKNQLEGTNQEVKNTVAEKNLNDYLESDALSGDYVAHQESTMRFNPENSIGKTMSPTFGLDVQHKTNQHLMSGDNKLDSDNLFKQDMSVRQNFHSTAVKFNPETRFAFNGTQQDSDRKGISFDDQQKIGPPSPINQRVSPVLKQNSPSSDIRFAQPLNSNRISVASKEDQEADEIENKGRK